MTALVLENLAALPALARSLRMLLTRLARANRCAGQCTRGAPDPGMADAPSAKRDQSPTRLYSSWQNESAFRP